MNSTLGLTRKTFETEGPLNTMEKGGGFLDNTFKFTGYRKRRLSKIPTPVIIPPHSIIIAHSPISPTKSDSYLEQQPSPKNTQSPTKRFVLKPITALTAAFQRTTITSRKSSSTMTLLKFPKSPLNSNNNHPKSPKLSTSSPQSPKPPKSPKLLHRKGSSGSIRKRSESPTSPSANVATFLSNNNNNNNNNQPSSTNNSNKSSFRFGKLPNTSIPSTVPKSPSKLGKFIKPPKSPCRKALPIIPSELAERLRESSSLTENIQYNNGNLIKPFILPKPILIDIRNLSLYQKEHIRDSFNVNLPTLLIKRYRRGNISNFSLDSFITTPEGRDNYLNIINQYGGKYHNDIIIFDENMDESDKVSPGWTLLNVLERAMFNYHSNLSSDSIEEINDLPRGRIYWLKGGFDAFRSWDQRGEFIITEPEFSDKIDNNLMDYEGQQQQQQQETNLVRRDSLFSVNTERNYSLKRKKTGKQSDSNSEQEQQQQQRPQPKRQQTPPQLKLQPSESNQFENLRGRRPSNGLQCLFTSNGELYPTASYGVHDFSDSNESPDTPPPVSHPETEFVVSTIIPDFLFLGPEITNEDEVKELKSKGIRRILNMAFECDDSLKENFDHYLKLNIKDSVEEDVENGLKVAVDFIERAQKDETPIYVHCKAGKSRSVTAVLAYLIKSRHWTLKHSYDYVMERRSGISPNIGFVAELMRIEEDVLGFKRNAGAYTERDPSVKRKEDTMDMEDVGPQSKSLKTALF